MLNGPNTVAPAAPQLNVNPIASLNKESTPVKAVQPPPFSSWSHPRQGSDLSGSERDNQSPSNFSQRWSSDTPNTSHFQSPQIDKDPLHSPSSNDIRDVEKSPSSSSLNYDEYHGTEQRRGASGTMPSLFGFDQSGGQFGELVQERPGMARLNGDPHGYQDQSVHPQAPGINGFNPHSVEFVPRHLQQQPEPGQQQIPRTQSPQQRLSSPGPSPLRNEQKFDATTYSQMPPASIAPAYAPQGLVYPVQGPAPMQWPPQQPQQLVNSVLPGAYINGQHISTFPNGQGQEYSEIPMQTRNRSMSHGSNASSASNVSIPFSNNPPSPTTTNGLPVTMTADQLAAARFVAMQAQAMARPPSRGINLAIEALPSIGSALQQGQTNYANGVPPQMSFRPNAIPAHVYGHGAYRGPIPLPPLNSPYSRAEIQAQLDPRQPRGYGLAAQMGGPPLSPVSSQASTIRGNSTLHSIPPAALQGLTPEALQTLISQPALSDLVLRLTGMRASSNTSSGDEDSQEAIGPSGNNRKAGLYKTEL
ncbi:hypothetical protein BT69DRAFT_291281 [Atractiella rhizophila]|nr:hypothetical protein BT69DRAFT_291281 [Atractiella rhizophila]